MSYPYRGVVFATVLAKCGAPLIVCFIELYKPVNGEHCWADSSSNYADKLYTVLDVFCVAIVQAIQRSCRTSVISLSNAHNCSPNAQTENKRVTNGETNHNASCTNVCASIRKMCVAYAP